MNLILIDKKLKSKIIISIFAALVLISCSGKQTKTDNQNAVCFTADSAYRYVEEQVSFGPRVPGTMAHQQCVIYLVEQLRRFGAKVEIEQGQKPNYDGQPQQIVNIIAHIGDTSKRRVILAAHYDSRPWADQEEEYFARLTPVMGANDGASGVGVLLEVARQWGIKKAENKTVPAVDIIFFDCEDLGTPDFYTGQQREDTWCLGSQLWAEQHRSEQSNYRYGILLDMVGAPDAVFEKEYYSVQFAQNYVEKLWRTAQSLGYSSLFRQDYTYPITDDHYYLNTIAGIPTLDIIHYSKHTETGFAHWWHTTEDDMRHICPATLEAVGKTVMATVEEQ